MKERFLFFGNNHYLILESNSHQHIVKIPLKKPPREINRPARSTKYISWFLRLTEHEQLLAIYQSLKCSILGVVALITEVYYFCYLLEIYSSKEITLQENSDQKPDNKED